jgi:hypothetical protein
MPSLPARRSLSEELAVITAAQASRKTSDHDGDIQRRARLLEQSAYP